MNKRVSKCRSFFVLTVSVAVCSVGLTLLSGCPLPPPPEPPAEAVLEGTWSVTPAEPGDCVDCVYEAEFDSNGDLVQLSATRADGATAVLTIDDATTELEDSNVVINVPGPTGVRVFEGTLSDDGNTMTGSITQEIDLEDLEITLPGGELTFERVIADPCEGVTCDPGETCVDGECVPTGPTELTYVGAATCLGCHGAAAITGVDVSSFSDSGHPFKLNKVESGQMPTYPFSSIAGALEMIADDDEPLADGTPDPNVGGTDNTLGTPQSYDDVTFVIGGYGWKARFIDNDGYIVTGSAVQYNLDTQGMVAYHNNETDKPYNCGNCHTTGWRAYTSEEGDDRNLNQQDDLPGMAGTFAFPGVQCEACHGAGSAHVSAPSTDNITRIAEPRTTAEFLADDMAFGKPVACSECHTRHAEKDYPSYEGGSGLILASGGLIRHHEQHDEMLGINPDDEAAGPTGPHSSLHCTACHNPHATTVYQDTSGDPPGVKVACTSCHPNNAITSGGMTELACIDCHMPLLTKSAIGHDPVGTGPATGDIRTHIFRIDLTKMEEQFTPDGSFAFPWITSPWACKTCHNDVDATDFSVEFLSTWTIHD